MTDLAPRQTASGFVSRPSRTSQPLDLSNVVTGVVTGLFGLIGGLAANAQSGAIAAALALDKARVDLFLTQFAINKRQRTAQIGYDGQRRLSNLTNAITAKGISINESLFRVSDEVERNVWAENESLRRQEEKADQMKFDLTMRATADTLNVGLAIMNSAMGGFQLITGLQAASEEASAIEELNSLRQGQYTDETSSMRVGLASLRRSIANTEMKLTDIQSMQAFMFMLVQNGVIRQEHVTGLTQSRADFFTFTSKRKRAELAQSSMRTAAPAIFGE